MYRQITNEIIMVRPAAFHFNPDTIESNIYQKKDDRDPSLVQKKAEEEFDNLVNLLEEEGIQVNVIQDFKEPRTTDCVFPNNWFSSHEGGQLVIYSMFSKFRRLEIDKFYREVRKIVEKRQKEENTMAVYDYSGNAENGKFLEGTGAMCIDRVNKVAYCALSPRADKELFLRFCRDTDHKPVFFRAYQDNVPIYHTNVLMGIGSKNVVVCLDAIDEADRDMVREELVKGGRTIVEISLDQVKSFLGNVIELEGKEGSVFCMSKTAYDSLNEKQKVEIEKHSKILYADIPTIEFYGGGSLRCTIAEVF